MEEEANPKQADIYDPRFDLDTLTPEDMKGLWTLSLLTVAAPAMQPPPRVMERVFAHMLDQSKRPSV